MKTFKKLLIASSLCISGAMAQTYFYNTSTSFPQSGYTYRCETQSWDWGRVTLFNVNNIYTDAEYVYHDGSVFNERDVFYGKVSLIEDDNWTKQMSMRIVNNAFSEEEKTRVKGKKFDVSMTINTTTGRVIEVDFRFLKNSPYATIPVTTYRKIEQELKNNVWFTLTPTGKQLKFVQIGWMHEVK